MPLRTTPSPPAEPEDQPSPIGREPNRGPASPWEPPRPGLVAFVSYAVASLALFGGSDALRLSQLHLVWGSDPSMFIWFFRWWPYALAHAQNPLVTHLLWAPHGVDLTAGTPIPGPSLVAAPLTLLAGPVVAYDVVMLLAPALSA